MIRGGLANFNKVTALWVGGVNADNFKETNMDNKKIENIAASIVVIGQIDKDRSLIGLIGRGDENSNQEAIENWISEMTDREEIEKSGAAVEILLRKLKNKIIDIQLCAMD